jgi:hypothetical protein
MRGDYTDRKWPSFLHISVSMKRENSAIGSSSWRSSSRSADYARGSVGSIAWMKRLGSAKPGQSVVSGFSCFGEEPLVGYQVRNYLPHPLQPPVFFSAKLRYQPSCSGAHYFLWHDTYHAKTPEVVATTSISSPPPTTSLRLSPLSPKRLRRVFGFPLSITAQDMSPLRWYGFWKGSLISTCPM